MTLPTIKLFHFLQFRSFFEDLVTRKSREVFQSAQLAFPIIFDITAALRLLLMGFNFDLIELKTVQYFY
jgi:hypothetical protein